MSIINVNKLILLFSLLALHSGAFSGSDDGKVSSETRTADAFSGSDDGKVASETRTSDAIQADALFWDVFHRGEYDQIPVVLNALTAAYLADPNDATTAAHIGFMHTWRANERWRLDEIPATITDHAVLARKYFQEAVRLNPHVALYLGFRGGMTMAEGDIHRDEKLWRSGYSTLIKSIRAFPELNYVTGGLVEGILPPTSDRFKRALEWQWKTLDLCLGEKIDRANPDASPYMHLFTTEGNKRVCWNGWIAPHNFEGFWLNMGDMLVKSGDWRTAQKAYANAALSVDYPRWKFRNILEERIPQAEANVALFNAVPDRSGRLAKPIMSQSAFACVSCHQD